MTNRFIEKVAVVTGGANGIGRAAAEALAAEGANVAVVDLNQAAAASAAEEITRAFGVEALGIACDVSTRESVLAARDEVLRRFDRVDVLVNAAGRNGSAPAEENEMFEAVVGVNLVGSFYWAQAVAAASMLPRRQGAIVNIGSLASLAAIPGDVGYVASKHAVIGLTRALAVEWAARGVRVNAVTPGISETQMVRAWRETEPDAFSARVARIPIGHMATTEDQARAIVYLASDDAAYITGVTLPVDGGQMALNSGFTI